MSHDRPLTVGVAAAADMLAAGVDAGHAGLLLVDLDTPGDPERLRVPLAFPMVVAGVGDPASPGAPGARHLDLSLTGATGAGRPWVSRPALDDAVTDLVSAVAYSRAASVTFAQVLRAGGHPVEVGLVVESLAYSTLQAGRDFASWLTGRRARLAGGARPDPGAEAVRLDRQGATLNITLNRPHVHNAYNAAMRELLCDAFTLPAFDDSISEVVLRGEGPSFCSGGDLDEFGSFTDPVSAHLIRTSASPARLVAAVSERVVARVHGWCVGSGIELPCFAGRVMAHPDTRFRLPELAMGLIPGAGGTVSLPARIGRHRTAWMGLTGEAVDAATALEWGLIDGLDRTGTGPSPQDAPVRSGS